MVLEAIVVKAAIGAVKGGTIGGAKGVATVHLAGANSALGSAAAAGAAKGVAFKAALATTKTAVAHGALEGMGSGPALAAVHVPAVQHMAHGGGIAIGKLAKTAAEIDLAGFAAGRAFEPQVDRAVSRLRRWAAANRATAQTAVAR